MSLMWAMCALHSIALMSIVCRIQMAVSTDLKVDETDESVEMNHLDGSWSSHFYQNVCLVCKLEVMV